MNCDYWYLVKCNEERADRSPKQWQVNITVVQICYKLSHSAWDRLDDKVLRLRRMQGKSVYVNNSLFIVRMLYKDSY